jgi:hypothetical protein
MARTTKPTPKKAKSANKTQPTTVDAAGFIEQVENEAKRRDAHELVAMMQDITGEPPKMWGPTIIGFGAIHYRYESGREGDICLAGFSPRANALVIYLGPGIDDAKLMTKLGKHKTGKGCLYVNKLDDVDRKVLRRLIAQSVKTLRERYPTPRASDA